MSKRDGWINDWRAQDGPGCAIPIPMVRVLLTLSLILANVLACFWISRDIIAGAKNPLIDPRFTTVFASVIWMAIALWAIQGITFPHGWGWLKWLGHFWNTNVCGWDRWYGLKDDGSIIKRDQPVDDPYPGELSIWCWLVVPWGGWFRKSNFIWCRTDMPEPFQDGRIRARRGSAMATICYRGAPSTATLSIETIFKLIYEGWLSKDRDVNLAVTQLLAAKDELRTRAFTAEPLLAQFINLADETVARIQETKRFIGSAQAQEIVCWMTQQMLSLLPQNSHLREKYLKLAEELEKKRKAKEEQERNRRTRGKKKR